MNLTGDGEPERVSAAAVTSNLFSTLGVSPRIGRVFTAAEDVPKGPDVVVLGHALWTRRFAADAGIVGRSIQVNGRAAPCHGIMPPDFVLPTDFENPAADAAVDAAAAQPASTDHGSHGLYAAARLKPGATVQQAAEELHRIAGDMTREGLYPVQMRFDMLAALADRRSRGWRSPRNLAAVRCCRIPAAHRLRQRRQPPSRARRRAAARDRCPGSAWRRQRRGSCVSC